MSIKEDAYLIRDAAYFRNVRFMLKREKKLVKKDANSVGGLNIHVVVSFMCYELMIVNVKIICKVVHFFCEDGEFMPEGRAKEKLESSRLPFPVSRLTSFDCRVGVAGRLGSNFERIFFDSFFNFLFPLNFLGGLL